MTSERKDRVNGPMHTLIGSGSNEFDILREHLELRADVRREVEFAFSALLRAANPSDRGLRFLFGGGAEWIVAAAAWSAGILTAPAGHNANGFDLGDLLASAKGLWSVKASARSVSSPIRLRNFMGSGATADWADPTLFVGPYFGGAVLVDPSVHTKMRSSVRREDDALVISGAAVRSFARSHPANVALFDVASNEGEKASDPHAFIKAVLTPAHFPILSKPLLAAAPPEQSSRVEEVARLVAYRDQGVLDAEQFKRAIDYVYR